MKKMMSKLFAPVAASLCLISAFGLPAAAEEMETADETVSAEESETAEETVPAEEAGGGFSLGGGSLLGGWQIPDDTAVSDELAQLLAEAAGKLMGVDYEPVAYLGSQLVAGRNHCFLCRAKVVYPGAESYYAFVFVYEPLNGSPEVTRVREFTISDLLAFEEEASPFAMDEELAEAADYLYIDYDFMDESIVGMYYLVPSDDSASYTCFTSDGAETMTVAGASAKELLDTAFMAAEAGATLPVRGGKGILVWKNEEGIQAYARNYRDYPGAADAEGSVDLEQLTCLEDKEQITAQLDFFESELGFTLIIPESGKEE